MRFRISGSNWEGRSWALARCLVVLADTVSASHPSGHRADGTVASKPHDAASPSSDHRPTPYQGAGVVRAIDIGETVEGQAFEIAEAIRRSRDPRIRYVIHEDHLYSSYPADGFDPYEWRDYDGPNPHDDHVHISTLPDADDDTRPWTVTLHQPPTQGDEMVLKQGDQGDAVALFQKCLIRSGEKIAVVDGNFGPQTTAAVRSYQQRADLTPATGEIDGLTAALLIRFAKD